MHLKNITNKEAIENRTLNDFTPCQYYDQLNKGMLASHTIFNYANFLIFLRRSGPNAKKRVLGYRDLLILDEGHQIENQIVDDVEITIAKKTLQRYIPLTNLDQLFENENSNSNLDYESDIETEWVALLDSLYTQLDISIENVLSGEIKTDAKQYSQRLGDTIRWIKENPRNWIVSEIVYEDEEGGQGQGHKIRH